MRLLSLKRALACSALAWSVVGCGAHAPKPVPVTTKEEAPPPLLLLGDDAFTASVHHLLLGRGSVEEREALLTRAIATQLHHAAEHFDAGWQERGLAALRGALYLARPGQLPDQALREDDETLKAAYRFVAPKGDEGAAYALLNLRASILGAGSEELAEVEEQKQALERWLRDTRTGSALETLGHEQRLLVHRALLEPTAQANEAARQATIAWIDEAISFGEDARHAFGRPKREETVEAFRAFRSGAKALIALSLRHGDAETALSDLEKSSARRLVAEELYERLELAAMGGDARPWLAVLAALLEDYDDSDRQDPEISMQPDLVRAAIWGTSIEVLRRDEASIEAAMPAAILAPQLGLPELAPPLMLEAVKARPEPQVLSAALGIVLKAIAVEDEADDFASARRVYRAAEPLFALASADELRSQLHPSATRVRFFMATVETKAGNLAEARRILELAIKDEPHPEALLVLSAIEKQSANLQAALGYLDQALASPEAVRDAVLAGEIHLSRYDLLRDSGPPDAKEKELLGALEKALGARERAVHPIAKTRSERLLARVLDRFGDKAGTARAVERAYRAALDDKQQVAVLAVDEAARALSNNDVEAGRAALNRALEAQLDEDALVYVALWLLLTEKATNTKSDGSALKALSTIRDERWLGRLASWGLGKLKDEELIGAARVSYQKTEALFYAAMAKRIAGEADESEASLRAIAKSSNIDLVEVRIAKDIVNPPKPFSGGLPKGAKLP